MMLAALGIFAGLMVIVAVLCYAPKWFKIIFVLALFLYNFQIGWRGILGIISVALFFYVNWRIGSKEELRHHSEEGTKFWE